VYNSPDVEPFSGTLSEFTDVIIPVVSASGLTGQTIIGSLLGQSGYVRLQGRYGSFSGTSMAAPHVTGAIAAIWRPCRRCGHKQILTCLRKTARNLGRKGRDQFYGNGLVQTKPAYLCLKKTCCRQV